MPRSHGFCRLIAYQHGLPVEKLATQEVDGDTFNLGEKIRHREIVGHTGERMNRLLAQAFPQRIESRATIQTNSLPWFYERVSPFRQLCLGFGLISLAFAK